MRDPERQAVCDILANGFLLTPFTKSTLNDAPVPWCYPGCKLVSDAIKRATEAENMRVLKTLDEFYDRIKVAHRQDTSNYGEGLLDGIDLSIAEIKK